MGAAHAWAVIVTGYVTLQAAAHNNILCWGRRSNCHPLVEHKILSLEEAAIWELLQVPLYAPWTKRQSFAATFDC